MKTRETLFKNIIRIALVVAFILLIPLIAMQFTGEVNWDATDFIIMGSVLFGVGLAYELIARRSEKVVYRVAFATGLLGAFLLFWVNGAVGIIGSENNPANLLYGAVFVVGLIGSLISRFKPRGMTYTLFTAAVVQLLVPVFALFVWPAQTSWGNAGVIGVFIFSSGFALLFIVSALLFHRASLGTRP